jgi:uncharacterized membrane protein
MSIESIASPADAISPVTSAPSPSAPARRFEAVDALRGAVMVLMVIDHTRDFFTDTTIDPTDLSRATPALFLTRWVTHFCAPVFAFLAGTGAYLAGSRGRSRVQLARYLATRGIWLVFLEVTVIRFAVLFDPMSNLVFLLVFWSIGASLIALAGLVFLPSRVVGALGVLLIATHNLIDALPPIAGAPAWLQAAKVLLLQPGSLSMPGGVNLIVAYPLLPWLGVVAAGYGFGEIVRLEAGRRQRILWTMGIGLTAAFVVLRAWGFYGDPRPWASNGDTLLTTLSFLNTTKNAPSLLFLLMTLGPAIALMAVIDRVGARGPAGRALVTFGRVPFFFFIIHLYLIHGLSVLAGIAPPGRALSLPAVYAVWAMVLAILYVPCRWFAGVKARHPGGWLSYL